MKTRLTPAEQKLLTTVRQEWIDLALRGDFHEEHARKGVEWLYQLSGLEKPLIVVVESPFAAQLAVNMTRELLKNIGEKKVLSQVWSQVGSQVRSQVRSQVWSQVGSQVGSQVWSQVGSQVRSQVGSQVGSQVRSQVRSQVESQVGSQVRSQVRSQVESQVWSQVLSQVRSQEKLSYSNFAFESTMWCAGWMSFYDYFHRIKIVKSKEFNHYLRFLRSGAFMTIFLEGLAVICKSPASISRDEQGRLHNTADYAIYWKDTYGLRFVHGVAFDEETFQKAFVQKTITAQEILGLRNAEQKAVLIQQLGYANIIRGLDNLKLLDKMEVVSKQNGDPLTYELFEFDAGGGLIARVVKVQCHTTKHETFLGVPREKSTETCMGAIAWTFGVDAKAYEPRVET